VDTAWTPHPTPPWTTTVAPAAAGMRPPEAEREDLGVRLVEPPDDGTAKDPGIHGGSESRQRQPQGAQQHRHVQDGKRGPREVPPVWIQTNAPPPANRTRNA
jgi:hypothetical protein